MLQVATAAATDAVRAYDAAAVAVAAIAATATVVVVGGGIHIAG